ncbi:class II glutamine amidotransferase [Streptomyces sp. SID3343]|uniref:class II glutamine amidotransferase n=1 Tax=Streptomyces sp. SID3343 TaxID=2690260 RepID=UPI00136C2A13|nr:class II glutamine amidotransferase [Streptomyces sp. SID3343]MYW03820.1 class II glutamine amidotransferase [Streptomyces sp. SID3343]
MCRLFGLSSAPHRVHATFWLAQAPDSLEQQSRENPDGTGVGVFGPDRSPVVLRQPVAAWEDREFAVEARELESTTFVAHVRFASTGPTTVANTHPFAQQGRLFAHNGVIEGLDLLDAHLAADGGAEHVYGQTDSERFFALVTREIDRADGDIGAGIVAAATWVAEHLPLFSLNLILTTPDELWALRYPDTHTLYVLDRRTDVGRPREPLDHGSERNHVRARSSELADVPCVVVASEPMDDDPGWRLLAPGELLRVGAGPRVRSTVALSRPPAYPLRVTDLRPQAAASQRHG